MRLVVLGCFLAMAGRVEAADLFDSVTCGSDVVAALAHKKMSFGNTPAVKIEARHKAIDLHILGADGIPGEDDFGLSFWKICGDEYVILADLHHAKNRDVNMDVIKLPAKTDAQDEALPGSDCMVDGKKRQDVFAIIDGKTHDKPHAVVAAWQIDQKAWKLAPMPTTGMTCTVSGP